MSSRVLKLTGKVDASWLVVFLPLIISSVIAAALTAIAVIITSGGYRLDRTGTSPLGAAFEGATYALAILRLAGIIRWPWVETVACLVVILLLSLRVYWLNIRIMFRHAAMGHVFDDMKQCLDENKDA